MLNYDDGDNEVEEEHPQDDEFENDLPTTPGDSARQNNSFAGGNPLVSKMSEGDGQAIPTAEKYISINSITDLRMCTLCGVTFTSSVLERDHMSGKRHEKNIRKTRGMVPKAAVIKRFGQCGQFGECALCEVLYDGPNDAVAHLFSADHLRAQRRADKERALAPNSLKLQPLQEAVPKTQPARRSHLQEEERDAEELNGMKCIYTKASKSPEKEKSVEKKPISQKAVEKPTSTKRKRPIAEANGKKKRVKRFCSECGTSLRPSSKFCGECGVKI